MTNNTIDDLSIAIIRRASIDYVIAGVALARTKPKSRDYKKADRMMDDCYRFFMSEWFMFLNPTTSLDGEKFINKLNKKIDYCLKHIGEDEDWRTVYTLLKVESKNEP